MTEETRSRFDAGAEAWAAYYQEPLGRIRHEVTWRNLVPYLPSIADADDPPRVLDAGGGSGELALELAGRGYRVWLLDNAPAMLTRARQAARALPVAISDRLQFCEMAVDDAPQVFEPGFFDVITCHTLIEYLPQPYDTLCGLAGLVREDGLVSLSFVNRQAEILRQVWAQGDPEGALSRLDECGAFQATLFGVSGVAFDANDLTTRLVALGLDAVQTCGVRIFADYVQRDRLKDAQFFDALLRLELAASTRHPYRLIGRYVHILANKKVELC